MIKLDGTEVSARIRKDLLSRRARLERAGISASLTAIRVGHDPASELYVSKKIKACEEVGIGSRSIVLAEDVGEKELHAAIEDANGDPEVSGILVQLPLPSAIDTQRIIEAIDPAKDVDGFHPFNVGRVATGVGGFAPCTPKGVMKLLEENGIPCLGREVVVVGASNIVGRPLAQLMLAKEATVTVCHAATRDLTAHTRRAEILCVGAGKPGLITPDMVSKGVVLVDVGINRVADSRSKRGYRVEGDISAAAREKSFAYTPVPGGVGPMTVTMLIENTLIAAEALAKGWTV